MKALSNRHRKAREWGKKDDKLRRQAEQAWTQTQTYASAFHRGAVKSGSLAKTKLYRATHGEFNLPTIPKKQVIGVLAIAFILFLLIGNMVYNPVVEAAFIDYHQVGHTYTPLWQYTSHDSTRWNYNSTCINFDDSAVPNKAIEFQYTTGDPINTDITVDTYAFTNRDSSAAIQAVHPSASTTSAQGQSFQFTTGSAKQIFSAKFSLSKTGSPVGNLAAQLYLGDAAVGLSKPTGSALAESGYVTMESLTGSFVTTTFSFNSTNRYTMAPSTVYEIVVIAKSATTLGGGDFVNVGADTSAPTHQGTETYYNNGWFNQGALSDAVFEVIAQASSLGANCATASTIISKASINLQSIAGRQFLSVMEWNLTNSLNRGTAWEMFLRTNGTLPVFSENWSSSADKKVRLLWRSDAGDTSGTQRLYISRGTDKSIDDEGVDTIVQTQAWTANAAATGIEFDQVLNFTGPRNVMYRFTGRTDGINNYYFTETDFQSQLQLSLDYYVGFRVIWDTSLTPAGTSEARLLMGTDEFQSGNFPTPLNINGVPAMCNDTKNIGGVNCPAPTGGSNVFDVKINPLDPSSWANAIVKGLLWVFTTFLSYLGLILGAIVTVFRSALDSVGLFLGLGTIGSSIINFFTGVANFVANVFTTVFGWSVTFASLFANGISFIANFLSGSNGFITWIVSFFTSIAGLWTIIQDVWIALNTVVLTMNQILVIWYLVGMFWVYMDGWPGFKNWVDLTDTFIIKLLRGGWWIGREMGHILLEVKQFLTGWI